MRAKTRKRRASTAPSATSHGFLRATEDGSSAGSAAWPPGWGSPPLPPLPAPQGLAGLGPNRLRDQNRQKGELAGGCPESVHPAPSVLAPAQQVLGCSPHRRRKWAGCPGHPRAGCGRGPQEAGGWGSLPWVPGSLGWGTESKASQHPVSLKVTLIPSRSIARAGGEGRPGKVGSSFPEHRVCARPGCGPSARSRLPGATQHCGGAEFSQVKKGYPPPHHPAPSCPILLQPSHLTFATACKRSPFGGSRDVPPGSASNSQGGLPSGCPLSKAQYLQLGNWTN